MRAIVEYLTTHQWDDVVAVCIGGVLVVLLTVGVMARRP